jgi:hypothetical protein
MRKLVARIRDYQNPPALKPEQRAAAEKHLAALAAPDFKARDAATQALLAIGPAVG